MRENVETCENCGRAIGKLETPRVHDGHIVCVECWGRLAPQQVDYAGPPTEVPRRQPGPAMILKAVGASAAILGTLTVIVGMALAREMDSLSVFRVLFGIGVFLAIAGLLSFGIGRALTEIKK